MKVATIILVVLGILASVAMGIYWVSENSSADREALEADAKSIGWDISEDLDKAEGQYNSGIAMLICAAVSLLTLFLMGKLKKLSALIFILAAVIPAILYPGSLICTFLFIIGGILAFFVKNKAVTELAQVQA